MAKERTETPAERAERKAAKAAKIAAKAGGDAEDVLHKKVEPGAVQKPKKDKHKDKHAKKGADEALLKEATNGATAAIKKTAQDGDVEIEGLGVVDVNGDADAVAKATRRKSRPTGQLVVFADPLADDKTLKKLLRGIERGEHSRVILVVEKRNANVGPIDPERNVSRD